MKRPVVNFDVWAKVLIYDTLTKVNAFTFNFSANCKLHYKNSKRLTKTHNPSYVPL